MAFASVEGLMIESKIQLADTASDRGAHMMIKAQIQFTRQQMEQLEELRRQTGATRTELVRRAVDYYIRGIREHGVQQTLLTSPNSDTRKAR